MSLKNAIKKIFIYSLYLKYKFKLKKIREDQINLKSWNQNGRPVPPPQIFKSKIIKLYARKFEIKTFVETGTYMGDTVQECKRLFSQIYSIELDTQLFKNAVKRFQTVGHISIVNGDSGEKIFEILKTLDKPCLFWLDGHYSEGVTAKGELNTPIIKELTHILDHKLDNHVILIDDARCFNGKDDYPTLDELKNFVADKNPVLQFSVEDDIIRIHK